MCSDLLQQGSIWSVRLLLQCCSTRLHWMLKGWCRNGETVMSLSHHRPPLCLMLCRVAMLTCSLGCFAPANKVCYPLSFCLCSNRIQAYMPHWTWFGTFLVNVAYLHSVTLHETSLMAHDEWWLAKCNWITSCQVHFRQLNVTELKMRTLIPDTSSQMASYGFNSESFFQEFRLLNAICCRSGCRVTWTDAKVN